MSSRHLSWEQSTILHQKGDSLKHILHLARLPRDSSTGVFLTSEFSIINSKTFFKNGVSAEGGAGWKIKRLYVCGLAVKPSQMQEPDTQIDTETEKNQLNFMRGVGAVRTPSNTVLWLRINTKRVSGSCLHIHSGLVSVTTAVVWRLPHAKLYGHGELSSVGCGSLHSARWASVLSFLSILPHDIYCKYIGLHTHTHTHPKHTVPKVCCVWLRIVPRCKLNWVEAMHKPKLWMTFSCLNYNTAL